MSTDRLKKELEKARQKVSEWQARARDIERRITEQENLEIVCAVRSITASPEELGDVLGKIRSMKGVPAEREDGIKKEGTERNET